jgi:hypothetical protein
LLWERDDDHTIRVHKARRTMGFCQNRGFRAKEVQVLNSTPLETAVVAVPETAGSALYGMVDVLCVTGNVWQTLTRAEPTPPPFRVRVVGVGR